MYFLDLASLFNALWKSLQAKQMLHFSIAPAIY